MDFNREQALALKRINEWVKTGTSPVYRLFGFAGTGKTTIAKHIAEMVSGRVLFAAYTGKAAQVLREKGCDGASTIHRLIYTPNGTTDDALQHLRHELEVNEKKFGTLVLPKDQELSEIISQQIGRLKARIREIDEADTQPSFLLNMDSEVKDANLIIIDECSMVDRTIGADLLSFGTKVLVIGDPAQLPPVRGLGYFTHDENSEPVDPDSMLTQVHRQAENSGIIRMATAVRKGRPLQLNDDWGDDAIVSLNRDWDFDKLNDADQVLVGLNATRTRLNKYIRRKKGYTNPLPLPGEKVICLRNNHDIGILNGSQWEVVDCYPYGDDQEDWSTLIVSSDQSMFDITVAVWDHPFLGRTLKEAEVEWFSQRDAELFDYGYMITTHKAQGSQWDSVVILDESYKFRQDQRKWLYTAITRASKKVEVIQNGE